MNDKNDLFARQANDEFAKILLDGGKSEGVEEFVSDDSSPEVIDKLINSLLDKNDIQKAFTHFSLKARPETINRLRTALASNGLQKELEVIAQKQNKPITSQEVRELSISFALSGELTCLRRILKANSIKRVDQATCEALNEYFKIINMPPLTEESVNFALIEIANCPDVVKFENELFKSAINQASDHGAILLLLAGFPEFMFVKNGKAKEMMEEIIAAGFCGLAKKREVIGDDQMVENAYSLFEHSEMQSPKTAEGFGHCLARANSAIRDQAYKEFSKFEKEIAQGEVFELVVRYGQYDDARRCIKRHNLRISENLANLFLRLGTMNGDINLARFAAELLDRPLSIDEVQRIQDNQKINSPRTVSIAQPKPCPNGQEEPIWEQYIAGRIKTNEEFDLHNYTENPEILQRIISDYIKKVGSEIVPRACLWQYDDKVVKANKSQVLDFYHYLLTNGMLKAAIDAHMRLEFIHPKNNAYNNYNYKNDSFQTFISEPKLKVDPPPPADLAICLRACLEKGYLITAIQIAEMQRREKLSPEELGRLSVAIFGQGHFPGKTFVEIGKNLDDMLELLEYYIERAMLLPAEVLAKMLDLKLHVRAYDTMAQRALKISHYAVLRKIRDKLSNEVANFVNKKLNELNIKL